MHIFLKVSYEIKENSDYLWPVVKSLASEMPHEVPVG
jgi:hypothetical protein